MKSSSIQNNLLQYIFVVLSILNFFSIYYFLPKIPNIINVLWQLLLFYFFCNSFSKIPLNKLNKLLKFYIIFSILVGVSLLFYYFQYAYSLEYLIIYLFDPIMLVAVFIVTQTRLWVKLDNVMIILSHISLIFWACYNIGISPNSNMHIVLGTSSMNVPNYFHIDFIPQTEYFFGENIARNSGLFNEPAYFAYPLLIALFVELFVKHNNKKINYKVFILFITILSTTSTSGIVVAIITLTYYYFINIHNLSIKSIAILCLPLILMLLQFLISNKKGNSTNMTSYGVRSNDVYASLTAWKNHIIFGNGLHNNNAISQYMYSFRINNMGSSAGFFNSLAYGGLWGSLYYIIPTFLSSISSKYIFGLAICSFILFFFVPVESSCIYVMLISYLWAYFIINKNDILNKLR